MKISTKNGPFVKSNITKKKIEITILICLIVMNLYKIYLDGFIILFHLVSVFVPLFIINVIYDCYKKRKITLLNYIDVIIVSLITTLLIPLNTSYILILGLTFLTGIIGKLFKLNEISLNLSHILIFNNYINTDYNIYIFGLLLILSLIYLIKNRAIKFRISISYILILIIFFLIKKLAINELIMLLLIGVYVIPYFKSSPNTSTIQYFYGFILGIISVLSNYHITYIAITILSIIFIYIDFYNAKILSKY